MKCKKCGEKIETVDLDNPLLVEKGICLQCGVEMSLSCTCAVCNKQYNIKEVSTFLGQIVCEHCTIDELLDTVEVSCFLCAKKVRLREACEYNKKYACRECGIKIMQSHSVKKPTHKKTNHVLRWFGL